jgi:hypothetical protein
MRERPQEARRLIRARLRQARRRGDALGVAEALLYRAELDLLAGRLRSAVRGFHSARTAFAGRSAARRRLAADLGAIQALALLGDGAGVRRVARTVRAAARGDGLRAALAENAIGSALAALGEERKAETCFRRALEHLGRRRARPAALARGTARCNLGIRLARRGATAGALRELDGARPIFDRLGIEGWLGLVDHNRAWALGIAGRVAEALPELRAVRDEFERRGDTRGAALARMDEAELLLRLGEMPESARAAGDAVRRLDRAGARPEAAVARLLAARARLADGARTTARRLARGACSDFVAMGNRAGAAAARVLLGEDLARAEHVLFETGHRLSALEALLARARARPPRAGAALLRRRLPRYSAVLRRWLLPDLHRLQARGAPPDMRIRRLRDAYRASEDLRRVAPTGSLRAAVLDSHLGIYEEFAEALLERGRTRDLREAFFVVDSVRARTLREEMERGAPGLTAPPALRELRTRLEALWRSLERRDATPGSLRAEEGLLLREVRLREAEYLAALREVEGPSTGGRPASRFPATPCLAFAVLQGRVVGLLADGGEVRSWDCGRLAASEEDLEALRFQVRRRLHGSPDRASIDAVLERLGRQLLTGVGFPRAPTALGVVLPSELGSVPLEALTIDGRRPLDDSVLTYLPYACARGSRRRRRGDALLVGIESEALPAVAEELRTIRSGLPRAHGVVGPDATRRNILDALAGKRLVHLAGHARTRDDAPPLSALRVRDGWITAGDLADLPLRGALFVLSACRTGDPALRWQGEALGGFPRALLAAGASGVVASRWDVADGVALRWMREFHGRLRRVPPVEALAQASWRVRERHPHPADWAAFLYVGSGSDSMEG